ncbi:antifungal protein ginkbilobin-like protein 1 [Cryptomeria japonica]|uniref:antifungal protein ginkbilobin-like protein 1 n=1 Tax=Cryptomeria japonica TaxID=3369 RepID=UPI0027DA366E|nr:antifungal protein ginkbilobin-like protein 1 [Cryptomeria japonica]
MYFSARATMRAPLYLAALLVFSVVMVHSSDGGGEIYAACNVEKYSNGSQFDTNLEALLKTLTEKAAYAGFGASVYGQETPNKVSGRLQCRGDLSPADCQA